MADRDFQATARIQAAYIAGETAGFSGETYKNPYDAREESDEHYAFIDGFEDGAAYPKTAN
jgi:hypothetical protein